MQYKSIRDGDMLTVMISGKLHANNANELSELMKKDLDEGVNRYVFDFKGLEYISSAGIRVILKVVRQIKYPDGVKFINVCDEVMEILELTGLSDVLKIE